MKANELMIGDWVAFQGHPYQMTANDIASIADCEARGVPTDLSEIPLTPEILEKNGFQEDGYEILALESDEYHFALQKGVDGINNWWWDMFCSPIIPINYVHELQHLIRLCGIEKEIIL